MDTLFKALGDPARRTLLDSLRTKDGQTLSELENQLHMTRFGVMKHLKVLEEAHLVIPRKVGRFKYHYLNALPLQEAIDRWIDPFLKPQAEALSFLKTQLENAAMKPDFVMSTFINCTHDALWQALTKGALIGQYHFACSQVQGDYTMPGEPVVYLDDQGGTVLSNTVISVEPQSRIEMDFHPQWGGDETPSRCVYLVDATASGMRLTIEHYALPESQVGIRDGWARFASGLKTYMETGKSHRFNDQVA